ncbi:MULTISPECIES: MBL fold metallo-hydrolase [unclassified Tenacibaculum]|uniref:MBL fold metallo-hydrolase n=1 Tax=unclassified Tenacibaculum TaxID=2635139 RepID=UPI001F374E7F|nr:MULTISPECIES: MBL fold metallo-hydrolase [unclassified Tenacibaculum]MCF2873127.1 MBL fold metallo-hydrolase [Tenacibaculum sp. Cn5-1]MCF2933283.1 MBL fold metallo-hydrolase [Tenacibaculum sp. Cn5-34]MCG7510136.1 MBL fold metallo-hydrolase [Tenacibaculum sp. Cn5-46]
MLQGQGGNIGLFIGDESVFMIDDQFAPLTNKILAKVKEISEKPIKYLVNTHWHGDHTGGNENMKKHDVLIFSQENVRKRMSTDQKVRGRLKKASSKEALPVITYTKDMNFHINGENILVSHVHNAHTDGDSHIYFLNSNVIHMGDTYFQGKFPFIDLDSGGSIDGYIASIDKVLLMSNDKTVIIPGHRGLSTKDELKVYKKMLVTLRNRVQKSIDKGKTLTEVSNDEDITKEYKDEYGGWFISAKEIRETIYKSLK